MRARAGYDKTRIAWLGAAAVAAAGAGLLGLRARRTSRSPQVQEPALKERSRLNRARRLAHALGWSFNAG